MYCRYIHVHVKKNEEGMKKQASKSNNQQSKATQHTHTYMYSTTVVTYPSNAVQESDLSVRISLLHQYSMQLVHLDVVTTGHGCVQYVACSGIT